jgi:hypothetical protein
MYITAELYDQPLVELSKIDRFAHIGNPPRPAENKHETLQSIVSN